MRPIRCALLLLAAGCGDPHAASRPAQVPPVPERVVEDHPEAPPDPAPAPPPDPRADAPPDARRRAAAAEAAKLLASPALAGHLCHVEIADPYVVIQQYEAFGGDEIHKNRDRIEKAARLARRSAVLLTELHRRFRELFADACGLPDLREHDRFLTAVVAWNWESWVEIHRGFTGHAPPADFRTTYLPAQRLLLHYVGDDALRRQDELPVAGDRVQKESDQAALHDGTLQLLHEYGALVRPSGAAAGPGLPFWLAEGLAEFMSAADVERDRVETLEGATFLHNRMLLVRIDEARRARTGWPSEADFAKLWTLAELQVPADFDAVRGRASELWPAASTRMTLLWCARAWCLVHFLWNYDSGLYRDRLLGFTTLALRGEAAPDGLASALGGRPDDWKRVQAEFEWYWDACLERKVGWKNTQARTLPFQTETDAPPGRREDEPR